MTQPIRFYHRNAIREIANAPVTRTVLQYLREDASIHSISTLIRE